MGTIYRPDGTTWSQGVQSSAEATPPVSGIHKPGNGLQIFGVLCSLCGLALNLYVITLWEVLPSRMTNRWRRLIRMAG
jgi:hypothetical protein